MSLYTDLISKVTGVTGADALKEIEQLMRDELRTLDNISRAKFAKEARIANTVRLAMKDNSAAQRTN